MTNYRRSWTPGSTYFFTVNLADRRLDLLVRHHAQLREAFRHVRAHRPFSIEAIVVLPEHLHTIWTLPPGDADYATRWRLIKTRFSRSLPNTERRSRSRMSKNERGIWQRRYWEHEIRDAEDLRRHIDYIHYNPVKHGHAVRVVDWPYSSFHRFVARGESPADWACEPQVLMAGEVD
jgi:putative transposase